MENKHSLSGCRVWAAGSHAEQPCDLGLAQGLLPSYQPLLDSQCVQWSWLKGREAKVSSPPPWKFGGQLGEIRPT